MYGYNTKEGYYLSAEISENFKIFKVETIRQKGGIDLIALLELTDSTSQHKKFVLNIENKWYHTLKPHQLEQYKTYIENNFTEYQIVNLFITCDSCRKNYEQEKELCKQYNYKFVTIDDITSNIEMELTGNDLFDAYWFDK